MTVRNELKRQDGLAIVDRGLNGFVITAVDGQRVALCPCCKRAFRTLDQAKGAADVLFPPPPEAA